MSQSAVWPTLGPDQICKGCFSDKEGRRDLLGWYYTVMGTERGHRSFSQAVNRVGERLGAKGVHPEGQKITPLTDHPENPPSLLARIWNAVGEEMGR